MPAFGFRGGVKRVWGGFGGGRSGGGGDGCIMDMMAAEGQPRKEKIRDWKIGSESWLVNRA